MHARKVARNNQTTRKRDFSDVTIFYVPSSAFDGANNIALFVYLLISASTIKKNLFYFDYSYFVVGEFQFVNKSLISTVFLSV